jgi:hypothetical protein
MAYSHQNTRICCFHSHSFKIVRIALITLSLGLYRHALVDLDAVLVDAQSDEWLESIGQVKKNTTISKWNIFPSPAPTKVTKPTVPKLLWSDEFDASSGYVVSQKEFPNPKVWDRDVGVGDWGWGNDEYQTYTDASTLNNAFVHNGTLNIVAREEYTETSSTSFTSARLKTDQKMFVQYGTIVAKIQVRSLIRCCMHVVHLSLFTQTLRSLM